jgi:predicted RecB family nuclease
MATKISTDCVESYLKCKTKAHLKALGEQGVRPEYDLLLAELRRETKRTWIEWVSSRHVGSAVLPDVSPQATELSRGAAFILNAKVEDDTFCFAFDGLEKARGVSRLGYFHYIPVLFHPGEKLRLEARLLLAILGTVLGDQQGRQPGAGIVYFGTGRREMRVQLTEQLRARAGRILREIRELRAHNAPPKLVLNSHCPACEFQRRCRAQAEKDDDLSLLSGMGAKEIQKFNRKGIFTVAQLSCTFRLRKRGKRVKRQTQPHSFALQATAIRDKRIYVLKPPPLPASPVRIYLDIEGDTERAFVYLLGMLIVENGSERWCSFWADSKDDEWTIFRQMLRIVSKYDDFVIVHYGSYETAYLKRMQKIVGPKATVSKVLARSVNILAIIYQHI